MHWAVLAGKSDKKYFWIDSNDDKLIGAWDWSDIVEWIESEKYYFIAIQPNDKQLLRHSLVPRFGFMVKSLKSDVEFVQWYGYYLEDLLEVFDCPREKSMSASQFFDKYGEMIYQNSCYWYFYSDEKTMRWEYENMKRVALAHELTLSVDRIPNAIAGLSASLTCIACGM